MSKLFSDLVFVMLPRTTLRSVSNFKAQIYNKNGAVCKTQVTPKNVSALSHILVDWEILSDTHSIIAQLRLAKLYQSKFQSNPLAFKGFIQELKLVPVIKDTWASNCIERNAVLSYKPYEIDIGFELQQESNEIVKTFETNRDTESSSSSRTAKRKTQGVQLNDSQYLGTASSVSPSPKKQKRIQVNHRDVSGPHRKQNQSVPAGLKQMQEESQDQEAAGKEARQKTSSASWIETVLNQKVLKPEKLNANPNLPVIRALSELRKQYNAIGDDFRVKGYNTAINALLLCVNESIRTSRAASKLPGIGPSISKKIEEFYKAGKLQALEDMKTNEDVQIILALNKIHGVGPKISKYWLEKCNIRGIDDVRANEERLKLTEAQKLGLQYYDDWDLPIMRDVSSLHFEYVKKAAASVDERLLIHIMGSYRRGLRYSHDIDYIITRPGTDEKEFRGSRLSERLVAKLKELGYIKCVLSGSALKYLTGATLPEVELEREPGTKKEANNGVTHEYYSSLDKTAQGWYKNEVSTCRRVDFLFVPWNQLGAALMYFTGNNNFNRMTRELAISKGLHLSNHGLFSEKYKSGNDAIKSNLQHQRRGKKNNYFGQLSNSSSKSKIRQNKVMEDDLSGFEESDSDIPDEGTRSKYLIESFDEKKIFEKLGIVWHEPNERNIGESLML